MKLIAELDIKVKIFSDNMLFCLEVLNNEFEVIRLFTFVSIISELQRKFIIDYGIFVRGAIDKGEISFNDDYVFGKGLIKVVDIEKNLSKYQRVIFSMNLINIIRTYLLNNKESENNQNNIEWILYNALNMLYFQCDDGFYCINYLVIFNNYELYGEEVMKNVLNILNNHFHQDYNYVLQEEKLYIDDILKKHKEQIEEKLEKFGGYTKSILNEHDRENILIKYIWSMVYHNHICIFYKKQKYRIYSTIEKEDFLRLKVEV